MKKFLNTLLVFVVTLSMVIAIPVQAKPNENKGKGQVKEEVKNKVKVKDEDAEIERESEIEVEFETETEVEVEDQDKEEDQKEAVQEEEKETNKNQNVLENQGKKDNAVEKQEKFIKKDLKNEIKEIKKALKKQYTEEELSKLEKIKKELELSNKNIKVLPVESIVVKNVYTKFDTPPVIKSGTTLIPVRGVAQSFDAVVDWEEETKTITIDKDEKQIVLQLDSNIAYVDGERVELEVPAEKMNGRTVVPLRFIAENLDLLVQFDKESETIEIEEKEQGLEENGQELEENEDSEEYEE